MFYINKEKGVYSIEFAVVASLFFVLFFAVIEFSRLMYTWNVLTEVSRRGARLATVCHVLRDSTDESSVAFSVIKNEVNLNIKDAATFGDSQVIPHLVPENMQISYLQYDGSTATTFTEIRLVRAEIVNYQHELLIPFFSVTLNSPSFSTTLPRESLGVTRDTYTNCW